MPRFYTTSRTSDEVHPLNLGGDHFWLCRGVPTQETAQFRFGNYPPVTRRHWPSGAITSVYWRAGVQATCKICFSSQLVFPTYEGKVYNLKCCSTNLL